jgi:molybdopterin-guanine dinucleotide biosynthesis protein A
VLAGGASRRFGGVPKGLERLGERLRLIDFVFAALIKATEGTVIASNDPLASQWIPGIDAVPDLHPGSGGLAGVEAALEWATGRDIIVVAWDMPFVNSSLLVSLMDAADANDADAAVPESDSPHGIEPFCAFYSKRVRKPLAAFLSAGGGAAHEFLKSLPRLHVLPTREVAWAGDPKRLLFSVNTPADLESARAMLARGK